MAEVWELYVQDENGKFHVTDPEGVRGQRLPDCTYHMVVMVWIRNGRSTIRSKRCSTGR